MPTLLSPVAIQQFKDSNGNPLVGGQLYTFAAGTSTPQASYTDATGTSANSNPVILNSRGEAPLWLTPGQFYKLVLLDASSVLIWSADQVPGGFVDAAQLLNITSSNLVRSDLAAATGAGLVNWARSVASSISTSLSNWLGWQPATVFEFMTTAQIADVQARTTTLDVTTALQAAAAAGVTRCPPGTYRMSAGVNITRSLYGDGPTQTIFYVVGNGYDAFTLAADNASIDNVGFFSPTARTSGATIALAAGKRSQKVKNFRTQNQFTSVIVNLGCVISEIQSGEILDTCPTTGIGIDVLGGNDTFITRIVMDTSKLEPHAGIRIQRTDAVWLTDNDIIHSGNGLEIVPDGSIGQYITWIFGSNNAFDSSNIGTGTYIRAVKGATIRGVQLLGHWCATNVLGFSISTDGLAGSYIDGVKLIAPRILNNMQHGILISGGAQVVNTQIIEPTITGNSQQGVGLYDGIAFADASRYFTVRGGKIGAALSFAPSQRYGLNIGLNCVSYEVDSVDLTGNVTNPFANGNMPAAGGRVRDNVGAPTHAVGTSTFAIGDTQIVVTHGLYVAPTIAVVTPFNTTMGSITYWTGTYTATTFLINLSAAATTAGSFSWLAETR